MKVKKKGISSILGALVFLQILLISMLLIIHVINNETNITLKSVQRIQALSEYSPISENVENDTTYLYSTSTFTITHVIYPNGEIMNTSILVKNKVPVSQILNGSPWAIIVTSQGSWYNVTLLGGSDNSQGNITFPNYHDYGEPLNGTISVSGSPSWNVLDGLVSVSPLSLVPVNITIGDPTTYHWALTDAVLEVHPLSSDGWINITYFTPISSAVASWSVPPPPWWDLSWYWADYGNYYAYNYTQGSLGVYVPLNISWSMGFMQFQPGQDLSWTWLPTNIIINSTTMQYSYIYLHSAEKTITQVYENNSWWNSPPYIQAGIGTYAGTYSTNPYSWIDTYIDFPSYPINSFVSNNILSNFSLPPFEYIPYNPKILTTTNNAPYNASVSISIPLYFPTITVYQADINLNKGEILYYGYDSSNNSWILLNYLKYNYRYPVTYGTLYNNDPYNPIQKFVYVVPNGQGGYKILPFVGPTPPGGMEGAIYFRNINNIQYITNYPVYIAIPSGTYLLQVNLS